ncbi:hypothetical protein [Marinagarivorans cellulosilyticus]|nr:hypothetical protein [Marinagarivorans cellulosilyticus]
MFTFVFLALPLGLLGCSSEDGIVLEDNNEVLNGGGGELSCAQVVSYAEPVITLENIKGSDGEIIEEIRLTNIQLSGSPIEDNYFNENFRFDSSNINVDYANRAFNCTLPCSFFNEEGDYSFDVLAAGYAPKAVSISASYAEYIPDCGGTNQGGSHLSFTLEKTVIDSLRALNIADESVQTHIVDQYFSLYTYGQTKHFYVFESQKAVLLLLGYSDDLTVSGEVILFGADETVEMIERWVNNQHSDGLYPEAAEPLTSYTLDPSTVNISDLTLLDRTVGNSLEEYDNYSMTVSFDRIVEANAFTLEALEVEFVIHQMVSNPLDF